MARPRGKGERVIVADAGMHEYVTELLTDLGYDAIGTDRPDMVLERLAGTSERCDLLVTELNFAPPQIKGTFLAQKVRALRPDARILFFCGWDPAEMPEAPWAAALPVVRKPARIDLLVTAVRRVLDGPVPREP